MPIPPETLTAFNINPPCCWIYFLFDLAWAKIPDSPLRPYLDKSVWHGGRILRLADLDRARASAFEPIRSFAAKFPPAKLVL